MGKEDVSIIMSNVQVLTRFSTWLGGRIGLAACLFAAMPGLTRAATVPVFIFAGQSNAVGYLTDSDDLTGPLASWASTQTNVLYAGPQESPVNWTALTPPTQLAQVASGHGFGPEISAPLTISNGLGGQPVAAVKFAANASTLFGDWDPTLPGGLYSQMLTRVSNALSALPLQQPGTTGEIAGFFWMQGEGDSFANRSRTQYRDDLTAFIAQLRTDLAVPDLPFIYGLINNAGADTANIRLAQMDVDAAVPGAYLVNTDSFARDPGDALHFSSAGTIELGIGFGNAFLQSVPEATGGAVALILITISTSSRRRGTRQTKSCVSNSN